MKSKRGEHHRRGRDARRLEGARRKEQLHELDADPIQVSDKMRNKLLSFLRKRTLDENLIILQYLAPRLLLAIEHGTRNIETRGISASDGVVVSLNGEMIQILVTNFAGADGDELSNDASQTAEGTRATLN